MNSTAFAAEEVASSLDVVADGQVIEVYTPLPVMQCPLHDGGEGVKVEEVIVHLTWETRSSCSISVVEVGRAPRGYCIGCVMALV